MSLKPPPEHLPAAHSMDTEWFAIDGHGHVAVFDSGEAGGVPVAHFEAWHEQTIWTELLDELLSLTPPGELAFVADGVFDQLEGRYDTGQLCNDPGQIDASYRWELGALIELDAPRDASLIADRLGRAHLLGCATPLVYTGACLPTTLLAAWYELGVVRMVLRPQLTPERFGVFAYDSQDYSGGPYRRIAKPLGPPLRAESLPTELRQRLAQVRFGDANFDRDAAIQPFEHAPSTIWGPEWIGTDGRVHPAD